MESCLFALSASHDFGTEIAQCLGTNLCNHEERYFDDGECYAASLDNVRGRHVFVIQSLYTDQEESVSDKLVKLLVFLGSLKDASASKLIVVSPYLSHSRQDRKVQSRAPITTKYLARLFKSVWVDRLLALDVHNPTAIQNAYHIPVDLLEANNLFAVYIKQHLLHEKKDLVIMSPDSGGLGRARKFRKALSKVIGKEMGIACMDKIHEGSSIKGNGIMGDVADKSVIIYDDMISSGKTILESVEVCQKYGAKEVLAACSTHGLFVGEANNHLSNPFLKNIVITDTVKPFRLNSPQVLQKLSVIKTAHLFAEAIRRIYSNESISDLIANHLDEHAEACDVRHKFMA